MNIKTYDEELVKTFSKAAYNAFSDLKKNYKEQFYYYVFVFDLGLPYISAWSYEALEKTVINDKVTDEEKKWFKWSCSDSPYVLYGYDEFFHETQELLNKRTEKLSSDNFDNEWDLRVNSMEETMKRLDRSGLFGTGDERKNIVINVEIVPPDGSEYHRAIRLNEMSSVLSEYLESCEDPEDAIE